jgi:hypothetical protein
MKLNNFRCEFCSFHGGEISSRGFLGYDVVKSGGKIPMFEGSMLPPSTHFKRWYPITTLHGVTTQNTLT